MRHRKPTSEYAGTARKVLSLLLALAMVFLTAGCTAGQDPKEDFFAPQEETGDEVARTPYVMDAVHPVDLREMESYFTEEDYTFTPREYDLQVLESLKEQYPEYAEHIQFFIDHIGAFHQAAVNNVCVAPEKIDFVLAERFALQTETKDWYFDLGGALPYYIQYDTRWAFHPYGNGVMGYTGCGPTCLAMIAAYLTGNPDITPDKTADFALDHGYYVSGSGTDWSLFTSGAEELGLVGQMMELNDMQMKQALWDGKLLVICLRPGDFTRVGHFVVVHSVDEEGFWLYDPNSIERSSRVWPYATLLPQIAQVWSIGRPE